MLKLLKLFQIQPYRIKLSDLGHFTAPDDERVKVELGSELKILSLSLRKQRKTD